VAASAGGGKPGTLAGSWNVDSFFDITYRIDFVGHAGGPLGGMSGSTTGTIRMQAGQPSVLGVPAEPSFQKVQLTNRPNPFVGVRGTPLEYRLPSPARVNLAVYDAPGSRVRLLTDERLPAGPHAMMWDGRNEAGRLAPSGAYFVKLAVEGKVVATT